VTWRLYHLVTVPDRSRTGRAARAVGSHSQRYLIIDLFHRRFRNHAKSLAVNGVKLERMAQRTLKFISGWARNQIVNYSASNVLLEYTGAEKYGSFEWDLNNAKESRYSALRS
jgi:hypothetical protein